jgi:hypothetical protein
MGFLEMYAGFRPQNYYFFIKSGCATSEFNSSDRSDLQRVYIEHHCSCMRDWLSDLHSEKIARARVSKRVLMTKREGEAFCARSVVREDRTRG